MSAKPRKKPPRLCQFQVTFHPETGRPLVFALDSLGRLWWTGNHTGLDVQWELVRGPRALGDPDLSAK